VRRNADFFRALNERTHDLEAEWLTSEPVAFVCECSELGCRAPVYLTVDDFREVRDRASTSLCPITSTTAGSVSLSRRPVTPSSPTATPRGRTAAAHRSDAPVNGAARRQQPLFPVVQYGRTDRGVV
jgi:hypothetical protein